MENIVSSIEQFMEMARERTLSVSGNPADLDLMIKGLNLDSRFNVPQTDVRIQFRPQSNDAIVLIPKDVAVRAESGLSIEFIEPVANPEGWNCVFPNTFLDIDGDIMELVFSIAGALANLSLYNLVSHTPILKPSEPASVEAVPVQEDPSEVE